MVKRIRNIVLGMVLLLTFVLPVTATTSGRGVLIPNDSSGIADPQLYEYLKHLAKKEELYTNDLADFEELTITSYEYPIQSIDGLRLLNMPKLRVLNLAVEGLDHIDDILAFRTLEELNLYHLGIQVLPSQIHQLTSLKSLLIEGGSLHSLPASLFNMITLKTVTLKHLPLAELSDQIRMLSYLEELVLDDVALHALPDGIFHLPSLRHLELNGLKLESLPKELEHLTRLETLHLDHNAFTRIPSVVFELLNLQYLSMRDNVLEVVDPQIQQLHRLKELDLYKNHLKTLPLEIINLPNLRALNLAGNPWDCLPSEFKYLSLQGVSSVHEYYGVKVCGAETTTSMTAVQAPVIRVRDSVIENFGYTNQDVVIESSQMVKFIVNDDAAESMEQEIIFSAEGRYIVYAVNEAGRESNTITFTIDKTKPVIKVTENANDLGIYYFDVAIDASEDGYFIINGVRQPEVNRLLILSEHQAYTIAFVDLAGNESNVLDIVLQAKAEEPAQEKNKSKAWLYILLVSGSALLGIGTYLFLQQSTSDED